MIKASKGLIKKNNYNIYNMYICLKHNILYRSFEKYPFDGLIIKHVISSKKNGVELN